MVTLIQVDADTLSLIEMERYVNETPEEFIAAAVRERCLRQVRQRTLAYEIYLRDEFPALGTPVGPKNPEVGRE